MTQKKVEWLVTRHVLKNGHQKDTCYDEIGLCSQNVDIVLDLIVKFYPKKKEGLSI